MSCRRSTRKSREQGFAPALYELGSAFADGRSMPQDNVEAHMWMDLAAYRAKGLLKEKYAAGRDALVRRMTPAQVASAERGAQAWKKKWAQ